jgi:ceramide glucosyltransferase
MMIAGLAAVTLYLVILIGKVLLARRYVRTHPESARRSAPITVVQPILGGDPALEATLLETLRALEVNKDVRVLWLVDEDDRAARDLAARVPQSRPLEVLLCPPPSAHQNPKSAKLQRALASIATEFVAVLDDDSIISAAHLERAIAALDSATLYTGLPCYLAGPNVWSSLVSHFVNNNSFLTYLPLPALTPPVTINGMFYVMRTADLRAMGGFAPVEAKLCDDYAIASLVRSHGGTIRQGITPLFLRTTIPDATRYAALMQRWFLFANVLLRDQPWNTRVLLLPLLGLPPVLFALSLLCLFGGLVPAICWLVAILIRHALLRSVRDFVLDASSDDARAVPLHPITSIVSELLQPLHWLHASLQHTLQWRTRRILLGADGTFSYVRPD